MHARKSITQTIIAPVLLVFVLVLAACQPSGQQSSQGQAVPVTGSTPASPTATTAAAMPAAAPTAAATATTGSSSSSGSTAAQNAPSQVNLTVRTDAKLGKYLADEKGMTLYIYTKDTPGKSVCEGKCLAAWPALSIAKDGKSQIDGKDDSNLSTITRSDGSSQVAYKGMPLYYWAKDQKPGDVTGQGVGGVWYVVNPENGQASGAGSSASSGSTSSTSGGSDTGYGSSSSSGSSSGSSSSSSGSSTAAQNAPSQVSLTVREDAKLGKYLADAKGMTLYIYTKDTPGTSVCEGKCLAAWPALMVAKGGSAQIDGKSDANLSTITRSDGSTQVAYKGMPLYYWVKDQKPGDVTGQGVGGVWYVVNPENSQASSSGSEASNNASSDEAYLTIRTDAKLGQYLADAKGMTLYIYTKDTPGTSVCEGQCLANWPALTVAKGGKAEVQGQDALSSKFSTITRSDGTTQVTFNGMPLYYWVKDHQPGDVTGQGVGGVWYVVNPQK